MTLSAEMVAALSLLFGPRIPEDILHDARFEHPRWAKSSPAELELAVLTLVRAIVTDGLGFLPMGWGVIEDGPEVSVVVVSLRKEPV